MTRPELPPETVAQLQACPFEHIADLWAALYAVGGDDIVPALARADRWFLAICLLKRHDLWHPWLYARCREVEAAPDGYLDLWAREHGKTSLISMAGVIQEVLRDPEITIGIFSNVKALARKVLWQIKTELEGNADLKRYFPDVLYADPQRDSPRWSLDGGLVVRRKGNPKEATVEGHGLVDGQPIGAHFKLLVYDDVVTPESVGTPEQIAKTTAAWEVSDNLGARGEGDVQRKWHAGTRYHFADTYQTLLDRGALIPRIYPATEDGTPEGKPVLLSPAAWDKKKVDQGPATIACQMLLNPAAGTEALFDRAWLIDEIVTKDGKPVRVRAGYAEIRPHTLNVYIMVDPASSRKKGSDYTAMAVVGVDAANNRYLLDGLRDRLKLHERWLWLKMLRAHWLRQPGVQMVEVGYERYGMQADMEHFELEMERDRAAFAIRELAWPREGPHAKYDRIQRLVPDFRNGRFFLPAVTKKPTAAQIRMRETGQAHRILVPTRRKDYEGRLYTLGDVFRTEFLVYPFSPHDDLLDAASRIYDMDPAAPVIVDQRELEPEVYADGV